MKTHLINDRPASFWMSKRLNSVTRTPKIKNNRLRLLQSMTYNNNPLVTLKILCLGVLRDICQTSNSFSFKKINKFLANFARRWNYFTCIHGEWSLLLRNEAPLMSL